jgi:predicted MFS family arabinose efflux permease
MLSQIGTKMFQIALVWWLVSKYEGRSGLLIGWLLICSIAPGIMFVRWIGRLVERAELRGTVLKAEMVSTLFCIAAVLLFHFGFEDPGIFFVVSFALALCQSIVDPAINKFLPQLSREDDMTFAVALMSSSLTFASFLGALFGALAIAALGLKGALILNGVSYIGSYFFCNSISIKSHNMAEPKNDTGSLWNVIKTQRFYVLVMAVFASINLFLTPVLVTMPIYVQRIFRGDAYLLAVMEAFLWAGMLLGAFGANYLKQNKDTLLIGFYSLVLVGISLLFGGLSERLSLYALSMLMIGGALGLMNVKFMLMFQERVPEEDKGRFFTLLMALINVATPVGFLGFGGLVDHVSVTILTAVQGAGVIVLAFVFLILRKRKAPL